MAINACDVSCYNLYIRQLVVFIRFFLLKRYDVSTAQYAPEVGIFLTKQGKMSRKS